MKFFISIKMHWTHLFATSTLEIKLKYWITMINCFDCLLMITFSPETLTLNKLLQTINHDGYS